MTTRARATTGSSPGCSLILGRGGGGGVSITPTAPPKRARAQSRAHCSAAKAPNPPGAHVDRASSTARSVVWMVMPRVLRMRKNRTWGQRDEGWGAVGGPGGTGGAGGCAHLGSAFHGVPQLALHLRAVGVGEAQHRLGLGGQRAEPPLLAPPQTPCAPGPPGPIPLHAQDHPIPHPQHPQDHPIPLHPQV